MGNSIKPLKNANNILGTVEITMRRPSNPSRCVCVCGVCVCAGEGGGGASITFSA